MPEVLSEKGTIAKIENILSGAKDSVYLVSPYLLIPESLITPINLTIERGVSVNFIYGKRELNAKEQERLDKLKDGYCLIYRHDLHGKAYFNEVEAVVTSFNLSDHAIDNFEIGIYFKRRDNRELFDQLGGLVKEIIEKTDGYCIKCGTEINYSPIRPFCKSCYHDWNKLQDKDRIEEYCHYCGEKHETKINSPLCESCNRSNN